MQRRADVPAYAEQLELDGNAEMSLLQRLLEGCRGPGLVRERSDMRTPSRNFGDVPCEISPAVSAVG